MTKQIKLKDGKILKIERCGECLVKPTSILGFCPLSNKPVYAGHSIRDDCPLEEWQEPTTNKESTKVEPAAPAKEDICTMLCPSCRTMIHIESCAIINEKDTEIDHLKDEINKRNEILQDHSIKFAKLSKENNRLLLKANDLEKALEEARENRCPDSCERDCIH